LEQLPDNNLFLLSEATVGAPCMVSCAAAKPTPVSDGREKKKTQRKKQKKKHLFFEFRSD